MSDLCLYCRRSLLVERFEWAQLDLWRLPLPPHAPRARRRAVDQDGRPDESPAGHDPRPPLGARDEVAVTVAHQVVVPGREEPDDPAAGAASAPDHHPRPMV